MVDVMRDVAAAITTLTGRWLGSGCGLWGHPLLERTWVGQGIQVVGWGPGREDRLGGQEGENLLHRSFLECLCQYIPQDRGAAGWWRRHEHSEEHVGELHQLRSQVQ